MLLLFFIGLVFVARRARREYVSLHVVGGETPLQDEHVCQRGVGYHQGVSSHFEVLGAEYADPPRGGIHPELSDSDERESVSPILALDPLGHGVGRHATLPTEGGTEWGAHWIIERRAQREGSTERGAQGGEHRGAQRGEHSTERGAQRGEHRVGGTERGAQREHREGTHREGIKEWRAPWITERQAERCKWWRGRQGVKQRKAANRHVLERQAEES